MTTDNLRHWNALCKTDPAHTKPVPGGAGLTSIKPMYGFRKMTEHFGPVGIGWGVEYHKDIITDGAVFVLLSVWYTDPATGQKAVSGPQWGGTKIADKRGVDDDCFKKSATDAMLKCMSYIGIGGDVHMGQFDDVKYRQEVARELAEERQQAKTADKAGSPALEKLRVTLATLKEGIGGCTTPEEVNEYWAEHKAQRDELSDTMHEELRQFASAHKAALKKKAEPNTIVGAGD